MINKSLLLSIFASLCLADEIDSIIDKINQTRDSNITKVQISSLQSPMQKVVIKEKNSTSSDSNSSKEVVVSENNDTLTLTAIINNSAFINGKWIKIGEKINEYKLVDIMDDSVYLESKHKKQLIFFKKKKSKINISLGR